MGNPQVRNLERKCKRDDSDAKSRKIWEQVDNVKEVWIAQWFGGFK